MKICHISYGNVYGGADIAAKRLFLAEKRFFGDHENIFLCVDNHFLPEAKPIFSAPEIAAMRVKQSLLYRLDRMLHGKSDCARIYNFFPGPAVERIAKYAPDVVHLHSAVGEMLSIADIARLAKKFPLVWTMHDTWSFSGCEQYFADERYINGYCRKGRFDFDHYSFQQKLKYWQDIQMHLISPSNWMHKCASKSMIHRNRMIHTIGNTIDDNIFTPGNKIEAKTSWGLDSARPVLAFGCSDFASSNKSSRLDKLLHLVSSMVPECQFLAVGGGKVPASVKCKMLGRIDKESTLVRFYRAADVFVTLSKIDNLPNMIMESLFCGTPVGAIIAGGIGDLVNETSGFPAEDEISLAADLSNFLRNGDPAKGESSRQFVREKYSPKSIAEKHFALYRSLTE